MDVKRAEEIIHYPVMQHESGSIGFLEKMLLAQFIAIKKPRVVIELGVFKGMTTRFIREVLDKNGMADSTLYGFDVENVVRELSQMPFFLNQKNITFVAGKLPETLKKYLAAESLTIDFAVIDGDHKYSGVKADIEIVLQYLSKDGMLFCHDYRLGDSEYEGTCRAIDECVEKFGLNMINIQSDRVWGTAILQHKETN